MSFEAHPAATFPPKTATLPTMPSIILPLHRSATRKVAQVVADSGTILNSDALDALDAHFAQTPWDSGDIHTAANATRRVLREQDAQEVFRRVSRDPAGFNWATIAHHASGLGRRLSDAEWAHLANASETGGSPLMD